MNIKQRQTLKEQIAKGINHGLNDSEIFSTRGKHDECIYPKNKT